MKGIVGYARRWLAEHFRIAAVMALAGACVVGIAFGRGCARADDRYQLVVTTSTGDYFRFDKRTGDTWVMAATGWTLVPDPQASGPKKAVKTNRFRRFSEAE